MGSMARRMYRRPAVEVAAAVVRGPPLAGALVTARASATVMANATGSVKLPAIVGALE